nr:MAG TPA: hypothetical protein [Caudoviricetes sp.]
MILVTLRFFYINSTFLRHFYNCFILWKQGR